MKTTTTRKYREDFDNVKQAFEAAIDLFYELNNKKSCKRRYYVYFKVLGGERQEKS